MGIRLVANGANELKTPLNIEMQMADREAIAAVERVGGVYYSAYYDRNSIEAAVNPVDYFLKGRPIEKRMSPPNHLWEYYTRPEFRGYLAKSEQIEEEKRNMAREYGYDEIVPCEQLAAE